MKKIIKLFGSLDHIYWLLFILYFLAFCPILLNRGVFWDDWTLINVDKNAIMEEFKQAGVPLWGYLHSSILSNYYGIIIYRLLSFLFYYLSAIFLYQILKTIKNIEPTTRMYLVLLFMLFPVNFAKIALINFPYALCYFLFFGAWAFMALYLQKRRLYLRFIILILFFISFLMNSLLIFYLLPLLYLIYQEKENLKTLKDIGLKIIAYLDFLILPLLFLFIKIIYFKPYGLYENYNEIKIKQLVLSLKGLISALDSSLINVIQCSFKNLLIYPLVIITGSVLVYWLLNRHISDKNKFQDIKIDIYFLIFGLVAFVAGVFPYLVVGATPTVSEWTNRHQILVPLGASFILFFAIRIIINLIAKIFHFTEGNLLKIEILIISVVIVLFMTSNFISYFSFQKDWIGQLAIMNNMQSSGVFKENTTFMFQDNTDIYAIGRQYRFYEYNGLMKMAFDNEKRFGVRNIEFNDIANYTGYIPYAAYNMSEYQPLKPQYLVKMSNGSYGLSIINTIKICYWRYYCKNRFNENINKVIIFEYQKLD